MSSAACAFHSPSRNTDSSSRRRGSMSTPERKSRNRHLGNGNGGNGCDRREATHAPRKNTHAVVLDFGDDESPVTAVLFESSHLEERMLAGNAKSRTGGLAKISAATSDTSAIGVDSPDCLSKFHSKRHSLDRRGEEPIAIAWTAAHTPDKTASKESLVSPAVRVGKLKALDSTSTLTPSRSAAPFASPDGVSEVHRMDKENWVRGTNTNANANSNARSPLESTMRTSYAFASPSESLKKTASATEVRCPAAARPSHQRSNPRLRHYRSHEAMPLLPVDQDSPVPPSAASDGLGARSKPASVVQERVVSPRAQRSHCPSPSPAAKTSASVRAVASSALSPVPEEKEPSVARPKRLHRRHLSRAHAQLGGSLEADSWLMVLRSLMRKQLRLPRFRPSLQRISEHKVLYYCLESPSAGREPERIDLQEEYEQLRAAVDRRDLAEVVRLLESDRRAALLAHRDTAGCTVLLRAGAAGWGRGVSCLLERGADAGLRNYDGEGLLQLCSCALTVRDLRAIDSSLLGQTSVV